MPGEARRYMAPNSEVEVVVSPTGRQRLQAQAAEQSRRTQPSEYNASKYKVYERPHAAYSDEQVLHECYSTSTLITADANTQQDAFSAEDEVPGYVSTEDLTNYLEYMRRERDAQMREMNRAQKELEELSKYVLIFVISAHMQCHEIN